MTSISSNVRGERKPGYLELQGKKWAVCFNWPTFGNEDGWRYITLPTRFEWCRDGVAVTVLGFGWGVARLRPEHLTQEIAYQALLDALKRAIAGQAMVVADKQKDATIN